MRDNVPTPVLYQWPYKASMHHVELTHFSFWIFIVTAPDNYFLMTMYDDDDDDDDDNNKNNINNNKSFYSKDANN